MFALGHVKWSWYKSGLSNTWPDIIAVTCAKIRGNRDPILACKMRPAIYDLYLKMASLGKWLDNSGIVVMAGIFEMFLVISKRFTSECFGNGGGAHAIGRDDRGHVFFLLLKLSGRTVFFRISS